MRKQMIYTAFIVLLSIAVIGCQVDYSKIDDMSQIVVRDSSFSYKTTRMVDISVDFSEFLAEFSDDDPPLITVKLFGLTDVEGYEQIELATFILDENGTYHQELSIPSIYGTILLQPLYFGLPSVELEITADDKVAFTYESPKSKADRSFFFGDRAFGFTDATLGSEPAEQSIGGLTYVSGFDSDGRPTNCYRETLSYTLMQRVYASLPEYNRIPTSDPDFLNDANLTLAADADVSVTFVHEGAGYLNALAYSTSDTEPTELSDMKIIFPNASLRYGGGAMSAGDTLYLGNFDAGTTFYWAIIANSWSSSTQKNTSGYATYYSKREWNPESTNNQHTVILKEISDSTDDGDGISHYVVGFEDLNRDDGGDEDFNDLIFIVNVTPSTAVDNIFPSTDGFVDTDHDGISDYLDAFPSNPTLAATHEYEGLIAFEDKWPAQGDYDFNDLVAKYTYTINTDAANYVREIKYDMEIQALGAGYKNGLYLKLPISIDDVESVDSDGNGDDDSDLGYIEDVGDGIVLPLTDNANDVLGTGATIINTKIDGNTADPASITGALYLTADSRITLSDLGDMPFDPFLLQQGNRDHEIHLADIAPSTDNGTKEWFGKYDDDSDPSGPKYYKTEKNLPWGLHIPLEWDYPLEGKQIVQAYTNFAEWAMTGGERKSDWYLNTAENRDDSLIYATYSGD